jgi:hypothetical protein
MSAWERSLWVILVEPSGRYPEILTDKPTAAKWSKKATPGWHKSNYHELGYPHHFLGSLLKTVKYLL